MKQDNFTEGIMLHKECQNLKTVHYR